MKIINKKLSEEGFIIYIENLKVSRKIDKLVFHHTSSPVEIWHGSASILHYYNIYKSRGWKVGPHLFIGPDGIWLFTPIRKQGRHAGPEGNKNSVGIEIVGRYFKELPTNANICRFTALVTYCLMKKFKLSPKNIIHHAYYHKYGFCSPLLTANWIMLNLAEYMPHINSLYRKLKKQGDIR